MLENKINFVKDIGKKTAVLSALMLQPLLGVATAYEGMHNLVKVSKAAEYRAEPHEITRLRDEGYGRLYFAGLLGLSTYGTWLIANSAKRKEEEH